MQFLYAQQGRRYSFLVYIYIYIYTLCAAMAMQQRRPTQDFTGILSFIPEGLYSLLSSPNCEQEERRTAILEFAVGLGLRCPSERTMALLTAMEQYRCTGQFVNSFQLHSALESTKAAFRRLVRGAADPNPFMVRASASSFATRCTGSAASACEWHHGLGAACTILKCKQ